MFCFVLRKFKFRIFTNKKISRLLPITVYSQKVSKFGRTKSDLQKALSSAEALEVLTLDHTLAVSPEHRCEQSLVTPRETALSSAAASWHRKLCAHRPSSRYSQGGGKTNCTKGTGLGSDTSSKVNLSFLYQNATLFHKANPTEMRSKVWGTFQN